ncbi:recombinase family protein [Rathayibacter sp. SD072]|uniref:recombinase family protein n=1 Tax=Rathayibacter sp. SD072 TaxID=2781731 RepID=UPI001F6140FE|nr:recombinase family protein [Rathayibacter sp. SD072]MBO0984583.1 recombinase family protein [Rathayibacter sp. SD072]
MSSIVGYARVPRRHQNSAAQEAELHAAGAVQVFVDHAESSRISDRPQWLACLDSLREEDTLIVHRLDRLGGTERIVIETITDLERRGVNIRSLTEPVIDTTTPTGHSLFEIAAVLAQLRVATVRENTRAGLDHARSQGRVGGRPSVMTSARLREARRMREAGRSFAQIAEVLGVGKSSVARALGKETPQTTAPERRVFFRDVKPYEIPSTLNELTGPSSGLLELPHHIYWGPEPTVDLDTTGGVTKAYQALLNEGTAVDQKALLNREILLAVWPVLTLPDRVRLLWEDRFPELLGENQERSVLPIGAGPISSDG